MNMGVNFLKAREKRKMSQKEASISLDVGASFLSQIEKGNKKPSVDLIIKAAELYGVNEGYFFNNQIEEHDIIETRLKLDGIELSDDEMKGVIAFVRAFRAMK